MPNFVATPRPTASPWGPVQHAHLLGRGIWQVMTASHGGIILSAERQAAMPEALALEGAAYEEDCDWALVVLAFADELAGTKACSAGFIQLARDTVRCWHPDRYERHTGEPVQDDASVHAVLRRRRAYLDALGKHCVTSAWGSWADWVPEGKTGVVARKVSSVDHLGSPAYADDEICALVDAAAYAARGEAFALEDHPHDVIAFPESLRPKQVTQ